MKRTAGVLMLLAAAAGCVSTQPGAYMTHPGSCKGGHCRTPASVPGVVGPWGQPVPMAAPYNAAPPIGGKEAAYRMMNQSLPMTAVQQVSHKGLPGQIAPPYGIAPPGVPGVPAMPGMPPHGATVPPPGVMPVAGPGMPVGGAGAGLPMGAPRPPGAVAAVGALVNGAGVPGMQVQRTEIYFTGPAGTRISWYAPHAGGKGGFSPDYIEAPGRYNFLQAAIYRLKLTDIPNHPGVELYPTLEVVPANHKTNAFLAHSAVPVTFTEDDFAQVASGNYVVKVIYLPDPQYQDLAVTGVNQIVSSQLEPGVDPIAEACRRGSILAVVRLGNILLELPNSPAMDAPGPHGPHAHGPVGPPPGAAMMPPPGVPGNGPMVPPPGASGPAPAGGVLMLPPPAVGGPEAKATPSSKPAEVIQPTGYQAPATPAGLAGKLPPPPMPSKMTR